METPKESSKSEETIEEAQLDEEAFLYAPIKKIKLMIPIIHAKHQFNWFTRPAALKTAEALLDNIEGNELSTEDQFKLYQCIAKSKPKLESLEKEMLSAFRKRFKQYYPHDEEFEISRYRYCINALLKAGAIPNGVTFKEILKKNPEALYQTIASIEADYQHNDKKEMLKWLSQVEDPNDVGRATQYLHDTYTYITLKRSQILRKINPVLLYDSDESKVLTALDTLGTVYRPISDLSPEFIRKVLTAKDPIDLIAQDLFDNPYRIKKVYNGLAREHWSQENLKIMLTRNNGLLLSEEAEHRLWSRIPTGKFKGDNAIIPVFETNEVFLDRLETIVGEMTENRINSDISSAIKKYESKRWFWERWFSKLPDPILKAKEILNSGTGYYKNLSNKQQFDLLQCLNEASKKDKRTTEALSYYENLLKIIYSPSYGADFDSVNRILTMVKEGIIDTPEKFKVATQKAKHWVFRCYEEFKKKNIDKEICDNAWSLIFNSANPEEFAEAISLLAKRNALNDTNLDILEKSAAPVIIAKASIAFHDQGTRMGDEEKTFDQQITEVSNIFIELAEENNFSPEIERKKPDIELIRDEEKAMKVIKITDALKDRKDSKRLFGYLLSLEDSNQLEKLIHNNKTLTLIDAMIQAKVFKEIPLNLFGPMLSSDDFFSNITRDQNQFSEIRKACDFELTEDDFRYLFRPEHAILLNEEAINSFWINIPEKTRTKQNFFYILDRASAKYGDKRTSPERFLNDLLEKIVGKEQKTQAQQKQSPSVQGQTSYSSKPLSWLGDQGRDEAAQEEEKRALTKEEQQTHRVDKKPLSGSK